MEVKEILVPVDFSGASAAALEFAAVVAEKFDAELHVLHVDDDPILNAPTTSDEYRQQASEKVLKRVDELVADDAMRLRVVTAARCGSAVSTILDYVRQFQVDLIVMGATGRSALSNILLGSVAENLMRTADCPVVTVRQPLESPPSDDGQPDQDRTE